MACDHLAFPHLCFRLSSPIRQPATTFRAIDACCSNLGLCASCCWEKVVVLHAQSTPTTRDQVKMHNYIQQSKRETSKPYTKKTANAAFHKESGNCKGSHNSENHGIAWRLQGSSTAKGRGSAKTPLSCGRRSPHGLCSLKDGFRMSEEGVPVLGVIK